MALTKSEMEILYEIRKNVALIQAQNIAMTDTHEKIKVRVEQVEHTLFRNGLNSKVDELHDWMREQKTAAQKVTEQHKEVRLLWMKIGSDTRLEIIRGIITLGGIVLAYYFGGR